MRRPLINITPAERLARVTVGLAGAIAGVWLLTATSGVGFVILEVVLVLTGALGHCPLYQRLGHLPRSLRGAR